MFWFLCIIVGIYLFFYGFYKWRRKRFIENIPTSKINSIAIGLVELYGKAELYTDLVKSPISGEDCIFYKLVLGREKGENETIYSSNLFYLNDNTGRVLINPQNAEFNFKNENMEGISSLYFTPELHKFLASINALPGVTSIWVYKI